MRKIYILATQLLLLVVLFSCNNSSTKQEENKSTTDTLKPVVEDKPTIDSANKSTMIDAMFVEFSLGDASHYMFKEKDGKAWDFGRDDDSTYKFAIELPKGKANETNQGWSSNKALQGKWFRITYAYSNEPQYEGGPMAKVAVIKHVEQKQ